MSIQNIYDKDSVIAGYKELRNRNNNANDLIEKPAILLTLPDMKGKVVLDLGCGFGDHCTIYKDLGAKKVIGVDISKKMLEIAKIKNSAKNIEYINLSMEDIEKLEDKFDVVCSLIR